MSSITSTNISGFSTLAAVLLASLVGSGNTLAQDAPRMTLSQGIMDTEHYGFRWDASTAQQDRMEFSFESNASFPLALAVRGYDVDINREVRVTLNGTPLGYLSKGISDQENRTPDIFTLPTRLLEARGRNTLAFEQAAQSGWKWGITDLIIDSEDDAAFAKTLITGVPDRQRYGWGFWGAEKRNRSASYTFAGGNEALIVSARGFDIDEEDEVAVYINGDRVGYLAPSADMRIFPVPNQINLPIEDQLAVNTVTFLQTSTAGWVWGVTDVLVEPMIESGGEPGLGAANPIVAGQSSGAYGWNYPGAEVYLDAVDLAIETDASHDLELLMRGFDIDFSDEVYVSVGSTLLGYLELGTDGALTDSSTQFVIPAELQGDSETIVRVGQAHRVGYAWGVTDISVSSINTTPDPASLADGTLTIDAPASGTFGWQWSGAQQTETEASLYIPTSADDLDGLEGIDIELTGYDINHEDEVEVLLNGVSLGFLYPTVDGEVGDCFDSFFVPKADLSADNYLVVRQVKQIGDRWGVQDVAVVGRYGP